jgi:hypothetical protein
MGGAVNGPNDDLNRHSSLARFGPFFRVLGPLFRVSGGHLSSSSFLFRTCTTSCSLVFYLVKGKK